VIDVHSHVLPGVDDGAETLEDAVLMCRLAAADGCRTLVATPHRRRDPFPDLPWAELEARLESVRSAVGELLELRLGAEVRVDSDLLRELDAAAPGEMTMGGGGALLLELEPQGIGPDPVDLVRELVLRGHQPIVAHPELTPVLRRRPGLVADLAAAGASLQVTAMSVTGELGRAARDAVAELFDADLVHLVASDAHRPYWRPPGLAFARAVVAERWGEERALEVTESRARALLSTTPVGAGRP
jgi:protein-tyrosine phosphatase